MSAVALVVYTSCLAVNWAWQVQFVASLHARKWAEGLEHVASIYAYLAAISMVVYDDVVLTKWLLANCKRKWRELEAAGADAKAA